jgi:hypothetical protein
MGDDDRRFRPIGDNFEVGLIVTTLGKPLGGRGAGGRKSRKFGDGICSRKRCDRDAGLRPGHLLEPSTVTDY